MPARRSPAALTALRWCGLLTLVISGCADNTVALQSRIAELERVVELNRNELAARQATIDKLNDEVTRALGLDPQRLKYVFYPVQLEIDSLSGGQDFDGKPGDDGVTVYLKPLDKVGDVVKFAGDIVIQLYDLANPPGANFLGEYRFPKEKAGEFWHGKLMTNHYTLKCPWQKGPPAHPEITVRAVFQDCLTGRVMSAQTTCKVTLPP